MKKAFISVLLLSLFALSACGGNENSAYVPFSSSDYQSENYRNVISELQDAGFTNVTTEAMLTYSDSKVDTVGTVTIDGDHLFSKSARYDKDVPIVVSYYYMNEPEPSADPTPASEESEPKAYTADEASIRQLAEDKFGFEYSGLSVSWDDFDEAYVVSFRPAIAQDETTWVYLAINHYIKFCQFAYDIDGLERVRFDLTASGMDDHGNDVVFTGLSVLMTRENFASFNWDSLSYLCIWDAFVDDCYVFSLHPAFSAELDSSKVFYDPHLRDSLIP